MWRHTSFCYEILQTKHQHILIHIQIEKTIRELIISPEIQKRRRTPHRHAAFYLSRICFGKHRMLSGSKSLRLEPEEDGEVLEAIHFV